MKTTSKSFVTLNHRYSYVVITLGPRRAYSSLCDAFENARSESSLFHDRPIIVFDLYLGKLLRTYYNGEVTYYDCKYFEDFKVDEN